MNVRLVRKSIIMVPCIVLVAAIIALGTTHAHARDSLMKENKDIIFAWLSGRSAHEIARGFTNLKQRPQIIVSEVPEEAVCVTVVNLGKTRVQVASYIDTEMVQLYGTVEPEQTKAFCLLPDHNIGLKSDEEGDVDGADFLMWNVSGLPPRDDPDNTP